MSCVVDFNDPEDGANGLTFAIIGNSKPNLFSFSGINPANGVLQLKFRTGIPGTAQLTIKATDRLGKSVSTIVGVNVQLIASLSDWENRYGGGNSLFAAGANSNLLRYAFGMNPGIASANGGLPQLRSVGNARLLSYSKPKYASDVGYHVEISSDLINWSPANHGDQYFEITTDMPNALQRRDLVILVDWPQAFLRVRADLIP